MSGIYRKRHPVQNVTTGETFDTIKEAAESVGCHYQQILRAARDGFKVRGCRWKYADRELVIRPKATNLSSRKAVIDLLSKRRWESMGKVVEELGVERSSLYTAIKSHKPLKDFWLVAESEYEKYGDALTEKFKGKAEVRFYRYLHPVRCVETGEIFDCVAHCARAIGVSRQAVDYAVKEGYKVKGKHYVYSDETVDLSKLRYAKTGRPKKTIIDVVKQKSYSDVKECAKDLDVSLATVRQAIYNKRILPNGSLLVYADDLTNFLNEPAKSV